MYLTTSIHGTAIKNSYRDNMGQTNWTKPIAKFSPGRFIYLSPCFRFHTGNRTQIIVSCFKKTTSYLINYSHIPALSHLYGLNLLLSTISSVTWEQGLPDKRRKWNWVLYWKPLLQHSCLIPYPHTQALLIKHLVPQE